MVSNVFINSIQVWLRGVECRLEKDRVKVKVNSRCVHSSLTLPAQQTRDWLDVVLKPTAEGWSAGSQSHKL